MCCRTSDNRAYMASLLRTSAQIPPRGTSDTLVTLYEILGIWPEGNGENKIDTAVKTIFNLKITKGYGDE